MKRRLLVIFPILFVIAVLGSSLLLPVLAAADTGTTNPAQSGQSDQTTQDGVQYLKCSNIASNPTPTGISSLPADKAASACDKGFDAAIADGAEAPPISNGAKQKCGSPSGGDNYYVCVNYLTQQGVCYSDIYKGDRSSAFYCQAGYDLTYPHRDSIRKLPGSLTPAQKQQQQQQNEASSACQPHIPGAANSNTLLQDCITGYVGGMNNKTQSQACQLGNGIDQQYCLTGFSLASNTAPNGANSPTCDASGFSLSWILCPIFDGISAASNWIFQSIVQPFLVTQPISTSATDPIYQIWSNFRIYGNVFLVITLLIMVFGESIGGGIVDAYTVKKVLPRLLAAAVLINLSIYIVAALVDVSNILGKGVGGLLTAPLQHCSNGAGGTCWDFHLSNTDIASVFGVGLIGLLATSTAIAGFLGVLFFGGFAAAGVAITAAFFVALPMIFATIAVFVTLVFRKGLIDLLVLVSPVAFALYCLPNTERFFKRWWDLLIEALMVYPIIVAIFGAADILSITILQANNIVPSDFSGVTAGHLAFDTDRTVALVIAFLLQFLPLFAIPFAFRFASSTMRQVYDAARAAGGKVTEMAKGRTEQAKKDYMSQHYAARARTYHGMRQFGQEHQGPLGIGRRASRAMGRMAGGYNIEAIMSAQRAQVAKDVNDQIATGRDEEWRGLSVDKAAALKGRGAAWDKDARTWRHRNADGSLGAALSDADLSQYEYRVGEDGVRSFQSLGGAWVKEQDVDAAHSRAGRNQMAQQAVLSYEMRKGITDANRSRIKSRYMDLATSSSGWGMSAPEAQGAWQGAAFENQNSNLEYKYTKHGQDDHRQPQTTFDYNGYVSEVFEKRGSYDMSRMDASSIRRLSEAWDQAPEGSEQRAKLEAVARTMQDRMASAQRGGREVIPGESGEAQQQASALGAGHVSQAMDEFVQRALRQ